MQKSLPLLLASLLLASATACAPSCKFRFCNGATQFAITPAADVPFTGSICLGNTSVVVARTGEPQYVRSAVDRFGISLLAPAVPFSASFFKPYPIAGSPFSGIGHEALAPRQAEIVAGKCFAVPVEEYRALDASGNTLSNVSLNATLESNCVSFSTVLNATR